MDLLYNLFQISLKSGEEIMSVYDKEFEVELKPDNSPVTAADKRAHQIITKGLEERDKSIPIISEEGEISPYQERKDWGQFWLVDPLDGTKNFVKRNGEFTVNIALINDCYPILGAIYAPAFDIFYFGQEGKGAYKLENASQYSESIKSTEELIEKSICLPEKNNRTKMRVVASRSYLSPETKAFMNRFEKEVEVVSSGSSLKFCLVAEGQADYYPRYAPTMEWDTGAGQAIVEAAGGKVTKHSNGQRFRYNRENMKNEWFLVERL
ncbi:3'(2'),5'-bisphosphate nucleotidase CysQ [Gracilibacillus sp. YIM 98692]|uniref:3'(2'),5'-bisphosphate nucleotidase CysQ n=1 Tax=Gracilibacillus sp. YIM 98692 TaxID=2663532 RepID=UPI0013D3819D|nr:3'(2'),5'-bisphosphate nucleotidase CysQ [Gracilibacillus sp. YIM 98692]